MFRTSLIGCSIGVTFGILSGAMMTWLLPAGAVGSDTKSVEAVESVNHNTGKSQLHLRGKPEIK